MFILCVFSPFSFLMNRSCLELPTQSTWQTFKGLPHRSWMWMYKDSNSRLCWWYCFNTKWWSSSPPPFHHIWWAAKNLFHQQTSCNSINITDLNILWNYFCTFLLSDVNYVLNDWHVTFGLHSLSLKGARCNSFTGL